MQNTVIPINEIPVPKEERIKTNIQGFDNLLGGGLLQGCALLFAGEAGVGKSTFILQVAEQIAKQSKKVFYASGEENLAQIKLRADRLGTLNSQIYCSESINLEELCLILDEVNPDVIIVDSLQMLYSKTLRQPSGSPTQMRYTLSKLIHYAKTRNKILLMIGHSTKSGLVAGIMTLQHMVDAVFFMSISDGNQRRVFSKKNRFGASQMGWIVKMTEGGLVDTASGSFNQPKVAGEDTRMRIELNNQQITRTLDQHPIDKWALNKHIQWLFGQNFGRSQMENVTGFDLVFLVQKKDS